jgi:hypothetical protein
MSIEFDDTLIAHVFVPLPKHDDWMAGLNRRGPDEFKLTMRFRHADPLEPGADPWENIDEKRWSSGTFRGLSAVEAIARLNQVAEHLAEAAGTRVYLMVRRDGETTDAFAERFSKQPYANVRVVKPGTPEWDELVAKHPELKEQGK